VSNISFIYINISFWGHLFPNIFKNISFRLSNISFRFLNKWEKVFNISFIDINISLKVFTGSFRELLASQIDPGRSGIGLRQFFPVHLKNRRNHKNCSNYKNRSISKKSL